MASQEIPYPELVETALRGVVRTILAHVVEEGLPGEHHFFIAFRTDHEGVEMPPGLKSTYPEEMTIVLQHQFWDLAVDDEGFAVSLRFGGHPTRLRIPWAALKSFIDPAAEFGLRFGAEEVVELTEPQEAESPSTEPGSVVSLDEFRKRDD